MKDRKETTVSNDVYQGAPRNNYKSLNTIDIGLVVSELPDRFVEESIEETVKHNDSQSTPPNCD